MRQTKDALFLEPGEVEFIAQALADKAKGLLAVGGSSAVRGLAVRELQSAFGALLNSEKPPVFVLQPASAEQAAAHLGHVVMGRGSP